MIYVKLVLALIDLGSRLLAWSEQTHWMNEGERRIIARQLKDANDAMAQAAGVDKEYAALSNEGVAQRIQEEGWYRD